jgi:uncharacterized protein YdaT
MPFRTVSGARKRVPSLKNLSDTQVKTFIKVFNQLDKGGTEESSAIAQAISAAKKVEKSVTKDLTDNLTPIIKAVNDELKQAIEVVYVPYELDAHDQWMRPETIEKACSNFNENLEKGNIKPNLYHFKDDEGNIQETEAFEVMKSWINQVDSVIGDQLVPEGAWICKLQYKDDNAWELRKAGVLQGVSIGALGSIKKPEETEE